MQTNTSGENLKGIATIGEEGDHEYKGIWEELGGDGKRG